MSASYRASPRRNRGRGVRPERVARYAALLALTALFAFPFYWMFVTSVEPAARLSDTPPNVLPLWDWQNYADAWNAVTNPGWTRYFANTVFIAGGTTALALATALPAAYAFATLRFPGKRLLFLAILMVLVIPDEVILIPQYQVLGWLGWLDSYQAQIVPFGASAFGIFLLRQVFLGLPPELWDAARLDGCSRTAYLVRVAAPLAGPRRRGSLHVPGLVEPVPVPADRHHDARRAAAPGRAGHVPRRPAQRAVRAARRGFGLHDPADPRHLPRGPADHYRGRRHGRRRRAQGVRTRAMERG